MALNQTRRRSLGRHASPPADFATRPLLLTIYRQPWFRIHQTALNPIYFGRSGDHRFDAPAGQFGVLYLGCLADPTHAQLLGGILDTYDFGIT